MIVARGDQGRASVSAGASPGAAAPAGFEERAGRRRRWKVRRPLGLLRLRGPELWRMPDCEASPAPKLADAIRSERQRVAADLHDLVLQDLTFTLAHARALAGVSPATGRLAEADATPEMRDLVAAAERAVNGTRRLMEGLLDRDRHEPVALAVHTSVLAAARDGHVSFDAGSVDAEAAADRDTREALVHIGREAVTNAVKHAGGDARIEVRLERGDEWRLIVRDAGRGFDPKRAHTGFGLRSMRQRASELGGVLRVSSAPQRGSTVEAVLP